jgi:hypothetical protein
MKDPVGCLRIPAGFFMCAIWRWRTVCKPCGTNDSLGDSLPQGGPLMPPWMEILLNVIGYAGFIAIAKYHRPSEKPETKTDR